MALALILPASSGGLDADSLVGLGFGLALLVATGMIVGFRRKDMPARDTTGRIPLVVPPGRHVPMVGGIGMFVMLPILLLAAIAATAISILKTFY